MKKSEDADGQHAGLVPSLSIAQWSWVLYDVGSWAFYTVVVGTYMPVYFQGSSQSDGHHMTALWSFANSLSMILAALLGTLLGCAADRYSLRKTLLAVCTAVCLFASLCFPAAIEIDSIAALSVVVVVGTSYSVAITMYNALLASLFSSDERHLGSSTGTTLSAAGSAILLSAVFGLHQLVLPKSEHTNQYDGTAAQNFLKWIVLLCALWWAAFGLPLARFSEEPEVAASSEAPSGWCSSLVQPLRQIRQLEDLWWFVLANLFLNEASGVCYQMSLIFALSIGVVTPEMAVVTTIYNRAISVLFSSCWSALIQRKVSPWVCYIAVQSLLLCSILVCALMRKAWEYWVLCTILACSGTGYFSFSRSVMASLTPPHMVAQVFGLTAALGRASGFVGPLVFGLVTHMTGNARLGFIPIGFFMVAAIYITLGVDLERGARVAASTCVEEHQSQDHDDSGKDFQCSEVQPLLL